MHIEIVNKDFDIESIACKVWMESRPNLDKCNADDVLAIDAPINDFPSIILNIESTIIEREVIASFRDHIMWAMTSRVNITDWNIPDFLMELNSDFYSDCQNTMEAQKRNGISQDAFRLNTPVVASTKYLIKASPRFLIKLAKQFHAFGIHSILMRNGYDEIMRIIDEIGMRKYYNGYMRSDVNPELNNLESGAIGDYCVITEKVPFSLRTHLIRHKTLSVTDHLARCITSGAYATMNLISPIDVQICASRGIWAEVCKKRSCWLAHYGMWGKIINKVTDLYDFGEHALPCEIHCPYSGDAEIRYGDKDPGAPCPMHAKLYNIKLGCDQICEIKKQIVDDKRPEFWNDIIRGLK